MKRHSTLLLLLALLCTLQLNATTISPYPNLGEMAKASQMVVLAQVERNFTVEENEMIRYRSLLRIIDPIKGDIAEGETLVVQNYHLQIGELERTIWGDLELLEEGTYLLFLQELQTDVWQASMLSYGALELHIRNGVEVLVPFDLGKEVHINVQEGQEAPEPLGVYYKDRLVNSLTTIVQGRTSWDRTAVLTGYHPHHFISNGRGTPPGHCTFLSGEDYARWENIEVSGKPVYCAQAGASDCPSAATEFNNAVNVINANYLGVTLNNSGTHSYVPTCSGGEGATDSEFTNWVNNNLGGSQHILVQFDDPCSEITDLTGCNGTLAIGGLYWFGSTYTFNSMTWRRAAYGYVVFNNGTGTCKCSVGNEYEQIMTHELSHTLNIGHIETSDGIANMNPSCCTGIQNLDIECLDFIYLPSAVPVELSSFTGQKDQKHIQLKWITDTEIDNDFYELERLNRQGKFEVIYRTNGMGTSYTRQSYGFTDKSPLLGTNTYRLSQTDFDGTREELGVLSFEFYGKGELTLELSPNPVAEQGANLYVYSPEDMTAQLTVSSLSGQRVIDQQVQLGNGVNQPTLDFGQLPAGVYLLQISHRNERRVLRFVKD
ncbi:MAG: T9SS type A sorting domain-containing protein [Bacteroidota bacterium]